MNIICKLLEMVAIFMFVVLLSGSIGVIMSKPVVAGEKGPYAAVTVGYQCGEIAYMVVEHPGRAPKTFIPNLARSAGVNLSLFSDLIAKAVEVNSKIFLVDLSDAKQGACRDSI